MSTADRPCRRCGEPIENPQAKTYCGYDCMFAWRRENPSAFQFRPEAVARKRARGRWTRMIDRCTKPTNDHYHRYGGRGIKVCERWLDFDAYYADTGDAPPGMTLDRIDNNGNYEPGNVRWADNKTQRANIEYDPHASKTHCPRGHPYAGDNLYVDDRGWRTCRTCRREAKRRQRAEREATNGRS